mmetsp:Transcript_133316/g.414553  ORF Transcript_133316/g.414553 Transcript_133316/m.414553 type:complete len:220 (+) Transcript_133316:1286-1945(+)
MQANASITTQGYLTPTRSRNPSATRRCRFTCSMAMSTMKAPMKSIWTQPQYEAEAALDVMISANGSSTTGKMDVTGSGSTSNTQKLPTKPRIASMSLALGYASAISTLRNTTKRSRPKKRPTSLSLENIAMYSPSSVPGTCGGRSACRLPPSTSSVHSPPRSCNSHSTGTGTGDGAPSCAAPHLASGTADEAPAGLEGGPAAPPSPEGRDRLCGTVFEL